MREPTASYLDSRATYVPAEFQHDFDVADCALDDQLEQLQRQYASALRAAAQASFELGLLDKRTDIHPHVLAQVKRQRSAADRRCERLTRAIDALEERLENE
jgi:septal ring factor EnvC (AmiA/AmiB activator)